MIPSGSAGARPPVGRSNAHRNSEPTTSVEWARLKDNLTKNGPPDPIGSRPGVKGPHASLDPQGRPQQAPITRKPVPNPTTEEWVNLRLARDPNASAVDPIGPRPSNSLPVNMPTPSERADAQRLSEGMAGKRQTMSDHALYSQGHAPSSKSGIRPGTPGENAMMDDFARRMGAHRDEDGYGADHLFHKGEYSASYRITHDPVSGKIQASTDDFKYTPGHTTSIPEPGPDDRPHKRIHTHNENHLPIASPADYQTGAKFYARHGEKNYLLQGNGRLHHFYPDGEVFKFDHVKAGRAQRPREGAEGAEGSASA